MSAKKMRGRPPVDRVDRLRAIAWFHAFSKLSNGGGSIFSEDTEPFKAREVDKFLGDSAVASAVARNWMDGKFCPTRTKLFLLYAAVRWTGKRKPKRTGGVWSDYENVNEYNLAATELTLYEGPDGSHLWDALRGKDIGSNHRHNILINPFLRGCRESVNINKIALLEYSKELAIPYLAVLIPQRVKEIPIEWAIYRSFQLVKSIDTDFVYLENVSAPNNNISLSQDFVDDCESRLGWYGLNLSMVLDVAGLSLEIR